MLAALAAVIHLATVTSASPCPLFGRDLPVPTALHDDPYIKETIAELSQLLRPGEADDGAGKLGIDFQNTSFSIDVYSASEQQSTFNYHHAAPRLKEHGYGTQTINDTTVYRIGSISKLLTAYLYLLEVGDASFNDPVTRYVPELDVLSAKNAASPLEHVDWRNITIGALATHMAGIPRDFPSLASADHRLAQIGFPPVEPVKFTYCGKDPSYPCNRTRMYPSYLMFCSFTETETVILTNTFVARIL
jgi:CubicO group peptidase (beta-lactamase class C family)